MAASGARRLGERCPRTNPTHRRPPACRYKTYDQIPAGRSRVVLLSYQAMSGRSRGRAPERPRFDCYQRPGSRSSFFTHDNSGRTQFPSVLLQFAHLRRSMPPGRSASAGATGVAHSKPRTRHGTQPFRRPLPVFEGAPSDPLRTLRRRSSASVRRPRQTAALSSACAGASHRRKATVKKNVALSRFPSVF